MRSSQMQAQMQYEIYDFYDYPTVGADDWTYTFEAAQVRTLETEMLSDATLAEMIDAPDLDSAVAALAGTAYAMPSSGADMETVLLERRRAVRGLFEQLVPEEVAAVLKGRIDYANLRLAVRRAVLDRPIGTDYSDAGNVPPDVLQDVFEGENYDLMPEPIQQAAEEGILAYYENKDIRQIDYAIDRVQAEQQLQAAERLDSIFLSNLFRIQIDLTNIRTMMRMKLMDLDRRDVYLAGGFVDADRFHAGIGGGYDTLGSLFMATPYQHVVEAGATYAAANESFLRLEQLCDEYHLGFLRSTEHITAGLQPVIAYLLRVEHEIRTVRLILTAKKNLLEIKLIRDRVTPGKG